MDDNAIVQRCRDGQLELLGIIIDRYHNPLIRFCYHLTGNKEAAAELYQETWERVLLRLNLYNTQRPFGNWLFAIAANLYKDSYRKRKRWLNIVKDYFHQDQLDRDLDIADTRPGPEDELTKQEEKLVLSQCLQQLDDNHRIPLILYYFRDASIEDVSEILGIPEGTVKSRLHNGKRKLRAKLEVMRL